MTAAMDDLLTAGDVSRMTGVPSPRCTTGRETGARRGLATSTASCHPGIGAGCVLMLWNGTPRQGFER
jgi:hypothetical protein